MVPIRVLIVDDHTIVRKGIEIMARIDPTIEIVGEARDGLEAISQVISLQPDVVLMDLVLPRQDGIEAILVIKRSYPNTKIIALTTFEDPAKIDAAMEAGADGYLLKDADGEALLQAIQAVYQGDMPLHPRIARYLFKDMARHMAVREADHLTDREKEVLQLVARGWPNKLIAEDLNLTEGTVKVHISNILDKIGVSTRTEAAIWALQMGLVSLDKAA